MTTKLNPTMKRAAALALILACLGALTMAFAQIQPDQYALYEDGVLAGEIYVPDRAPGQSLYAEHWILYPNYVYPSKANGIKLEIVPAPETATHYTSEADFFARAPFGPGYRYVHTACNDTARLPGRP